MDALLMALAASAAIVLTVCLAVPPVQSAWRRRHEAKRFYGRLRNLDRRPKLVIPEADDTAAAITRFRRAVLHSDLADYLRPD
jgi:hypothetical protein